jgi:hypothetical protein
VTTIHYDIPGRRRRGLKLLVYEALSLKLLVYEALSIYLVGARSAVEVDDTVLRLVSSSSD